MDDMRQLSMGALRTPEDWCFSVYVLEVLWYVILNNVAKNAWTLNQKLSTPISCCKNNVEIPLTSIMVF
jgi:hypothetical protein